MSESGTGSGAPPSERPAPASDVAKLRALAHPARLALLEHLGRSGAATATECAGVVGLSPSAVSYHLRALARAGLVATAPGRGDGRERMWRRTSEHYEVELGAGPDPKTREAMRELLDSVLARDDSRVRQYLARIGDEPAEWRDAGLIASATLLLTAEELRELTGELGRLLARYRRGSRADVPPGAREVSAVVRALPQ